MRLLGAARSAVSRRPERSDSTGWATPLPGVLSKFFYLNYLTTNTYFCWIAFFLLTANLSLVFYYLICTVFTERSAASQTALWRGPGPRFEPGTGGSIVAVHLCMIFTVLSSMKSLNNLDCCNFYYAILIMEYNFLCLHLLGILFCKLYYNNLFPH